MFVTGPAGKAAAELPFLGATENTWHLFVHKLRSWVPLTDEEDDDKLQVSDFARPYLLLVVSVRMRRIVVPHTL